MESPNINASAKANTNDNQFSTEVNFLNNFYTKFSINDEATKKEIGDKLNSICGDNSKPISELNRKQLKEVFGPKIGEYFLIYFHPEKRKIKIVNKSKNNKTASSTYDNSSINTEIGLIDDKFISDCFNNQNLFIAAPDWKGDPYVIIQYKNEMNRVVWKLKKYGNRTPLPISLDYDEILLPWELGAVSVPNDEHFPFQNEASYLVNWTMRYENEYNIDLIKLQKEGYNELNKNFHSIHYGIYGLQWFLLAFSDTTNTLYIITLNPKKTEVIGSQMVNANSHGMVNKDLLDRAKSVPIYYIFQYFYDKFGKQNKEKKINFVMCGNKIGGSIAEILTVLLFEELSGNYAQNINILSLAFNSQDWCDEDYKKYLAKQNYSIIDRPISTYLKHISLTSGDMHASNASSLSVKGSNGCVNFALDKEMIEKTLSMKLRVSGANSVVPKLNFESIYCPMICDVRFRFDSSQPWKGLERTCYVNEGENNVNCKYILIYEGGKFDGSSPRKKCSITIRTPFEEIIIENVHVESVNAKTEFHVSQLQTFAYYMVYCPSKEFEELSLLIEVLDRVIKEQPTLLSTIKHMRDKPEKSSEDFVQFGKTLTILNQSAINSMYDGVKFIDTISGNLMAAPFVVPFIPIILIMLPFLPSNGPGLSISFHRIVLTALEHVTSVDYGISYTNRNILEIEIEFVKRLGLYLELKQDLNLEKMSFNEVLTHLEQAKNNESWYSWFFKIRMSIVNESLAPILSVAFIRKFLRNNYFIGIFGTKDAGKSTLLQEILRYFGKNKEADSVAAGLGNAGETLGISMFTLDIEGKRVNLIDFPGSDGLTTSKIFKEGRLQLDIAIAVTDATQGINQAVVEVVYESLSNSPGALMLFNNQADKLRNDSIGTDMRLEEFKVNTLNELNFGVEKYSEICKTKAFIVEKEQFYLTAIKPKAGTDRKNGVLYDEEVINEIVRVLRYDNN